MRGLEWSTGSSTQWVLMRIKSLISIEHHALWSQVPTDLSFALSSVFQLDDVSVHANRAVSPPGVAARARRPVHGWPGADELWPRDTPVLAAQMVQEYMTRVFGPDDLAMRWKLYSVEPAPGTNTSGPDLEDPSKFRWAPGVAGCRACVCLRSSAHCHAVSDHYHITLAKLSGRNRTAGTYGTSSQLATHTCSSARRSARV